MTNKPAGRQRAIPLIIHDGKIALMERWKDGKNYWVFPGGGVDEGETIPQAAARETWEELSLKIEVGRKIYEIQWDNGNAAHFLTATYISGTIGLQPDSVETTRGPNNRYAPAWVPLEKLPSLLLYPLEVRDWVIEDIKKNFEGVNRQANFVFADTRKSL